MSLSPLESYEQYASARASEGYTIIMFTGTSCPPCKTIYPVYQELSAKADPSRLRCYTIDASTNEEKILGTPTFVLYKAGTKLASCTGADRAALTNMFRRTVDLRDVAAAPSFALAAPGTKARRLST